MEKHSPHCPLSKVKELAKAGKIRATATAMQCARRLGFRGSAMFAEIERLERDEFYKSMTTYANHTIWQDVYHHQSPAGMLYIKVTVVDDVLVVSFKEL